MLDRTYCWDPEYSSPKGKKGRGKEIRAHIGRIVNGEFFTDAQYQEKFKRGGVARTFVRPKTRAYYKKDKKSDRVPPIKLPVTDSEIKAPATAVASTDLLPERLAPLSLP